MKELKEKILLEGKVLNENVLKVDGFINHQVDPQLMNDIGEEFAKKFGDREITKVVTIESSGIAPALTTAQKLGKNMVIMKKRTSKILNDDFYQTAVISYTKGEEYNLTASKKFVNKGDKILIIDDFLANGEACMGAVKLIREAGAEIVGIGILIEKSFQPGRKKLDDQGLEVYSLVRIKSLKEGKIEFLN